MTISVSYTHLDVYKRQVGLNVLLDEEDKVKVAGGFLVQVLLGAKEEEIARFEKRIQEMPAISTLLESEDHIEALLKACLLYTSFICHGSHIACVIGWQSFKLKEGFRCFFRIVHISF